MSRLLRRILRSRKISFSKSSSPKTFSMGVFHILIRSVVQRRFLLVGVVASFYLVVYILNSDEEIKVHSNDRYSDIDKNPPADGENVFFIETGVTTDSVLLTARQACAIESAAWTNPDLKIFLIFASQERLEKLQITPEVEAIQSYPNVKLTYLKIEEISKNSPLEQFFKSNTLAKSEFKVEHTSDVLRLLILWKFGGTYLDLDMVVREKLDSVPPNYACLESVDFINNAVINLNSDTGRKFAEILIKDLVSKYNPKVFGFNGPLLLTRVFEEVCQTKNKTEMVTKGDCDGFHVLDINKCYPLSKDWEKLLKDEFSEEAMNSIQEALTVHFTNHLSKQVKLMKNQTAAYVQLAKKYCPKVISVESEFF